MLKNEDIDAAMNGKSLPMDCYELLEFAREVERAVLNKLGEQKAFVWLWVHQNGKCANSIFDSEQDAIDSWASMSNGGKAVAAYIAHPMPAQSTCFTSRDMASASAQGFRDGQAQAVPEKIKPATRTLESMGYANGWNDCIDAMLSVATKP